MHNQRTDRRGHRHRSLEIKTTLCKIGHEEFCCKVGARDVECTDYGEWLFDVTWLEYDGEFVIDACLVAECEWRGDEEVEWDFQKLLLARATVRLMIFDGNYDPRSEKIAACLAKQVGRFRRSRDEDGWLLVAWERCESGWRFRCFLVDEGRVCELLPPSSPRE